MIQQRTLDDFKGQKIPYYYKAAKKKDLPLHVQNQMILNHFKTHPFYKILGFFVSIYSFFSFFKYAMFSRFLEISKVNAATEKKNRIQKNLLENDLWIKDLLHQKAEFFKILKEQQDQIEYLENLKVLRSQQS